MAISLVFAFWCLLKKCEKNRFFLLAIFLFLFVISAIRINVGADYVHMQKDVYNRIAGNFAGGSYVEAGYSFINALVYNITSGNYQWLLVISALLYSTVFFLLIDRLVDKKWRPYSAFLYIGTGIFFATLNLTRQYWAISLVIIAFLLFLKYKDAKKLKVILGFVVPLLLIAVSATFHLSSLVSLLFIPTYLLSKTKHSKKIFIVLLIISILIMIIDVRHIISAASFMLPERWVWYMQSKFFTTRNLSAIVKQIPILIMSVYVLFRYKELASKNKHFYPTVTLFFLNTIITNVCFGIMVLLRLSYYFDFSVLLLLPMVLEDIKEKFGKKLYIAALICVTAYYVTLTVVTVFLMNGQGVMPYNSLIGGF